MEHNGNKLEVAKMTDWTKRYTSANGAIYMSKDDAVDAMKALVKDAPLSIDQYDHWVFLAGVLSLHGVEVGHEFYQVSDKNAVDSFEDGF